jgi:hypothetical protein
VTQPLSLYNKNLVSLFAFTWANLYVRYASEVIQLPLRIANESLALLRGAPDATLEPRHALRLVVPHYSLPSTASTASSSAARLASAQAIRRLSAERNVTLAPASAAASAAALVSATCDALKDFECDEKFCDGGVSFSAYVAVDAAAVADVGATDETELLLVSSFATANDTASSAVDSAVRHRNRRGGGGGGGWSSWFGGGLLRRTRSDVARGKTQPATDEASGGGGNIVAVTVIHSVRVVVASPAATAAADEAAAAYADGFVTVTAPPEDVPADAVTFHGYERALLAARRALRQPPHSPPAEPRGAPSAGAGRGGLLAGELGVFGKCGVDCGGLASFLVNAAARHGDDVLAAVDVRDVYDDDATVCYTYRGACLSATKTRPFTLLLSIFAFWIGFLQNVFDRVWVTPFL